MDNTILKHKTLLVIVITIITMIAEIYYGIISHSMALTADGFHMGTHALALGITFLVCLFAIKYEDKTEKFNALGGYTSAILLGFTSLGIIWESFKRFFHPLNISFNEAIIIAIIGLIVNLLCVIIMDCKNHHHTHNHCAHSLPKNKSEDDNLNYKAAYLHILADALTSIFAISALFLGKYLGWIILDPIIGILGGIIIAKWAIDLLLSSSKILLGFKH